MLQLSPPGYVFNLYHVHILTSRDAASESAIEPIKFLCDETERLGDETEHLYTDLYEEEQRRERLEVSLSALESDSRRQPIQHQPALWLTLVEEFIELFSRDAYGIDPGVGALSPGDNPKREATYWRVG